MKRFMCHVQVPLSVSNYNCKSCRDKICLTGFGVGGTTQEHRRMVLISNGVAHGRIKKVSRARAPLVDGTTLQPRLLDIPLSELSPNNVTHANDVSILRARATDVRMRFQRLFRILFGGGVDRCKSKSLEGNGCARSRVSKLLQFIDWHLPKVKSFTAMIRASERFNFELQQADRGRVELNMRMKQKGEAIARELSNRNVECWSSEMPNNIEPLVVKQNIAPTNNDDSALARMDNGARACNTISASAPAPLYPAVYREQVSRIERLQREEELGIKAPTTEEIRTYNRTKAYFEQNYDAVIDIDKSKEIRSNVRSHRCRQARARKRDLRAYIASAYGTSDPLSDQDEDVANTN